MRAKRSRPTRLNWLVLFPYPKPGFLPAYGELLKKPRRLAGLFWSGCGDETMDSSRGVLSLRAGAQVHQSSKGPASSPEIGQGRIEMFARELRPRRVGEK